MAESVSISLTPMQPEDKLGRAVFDQRQAIKVARGKPIPHRIFKPPKGSTIISVDQLDLAPDEDIARIQDILASARGQPQTFHGWVTLTVAKASNNGRHVYPDPQMDAKPPNPYHAEIEYNVDLTTDDAVDQITEHAHELAAAGKWRARP